MRRRDSHAGSYTVIGLIYAELHPPAGPADEPVPRRGARGEGSLSSPPPPDSPSDDKPSPSPSDGGIGNSSVTAAGWLRMLAEMSPPKMLATSTRTCRSR